MASAADVARAQALATFLAQPTDAVSPVPFALNPALPAVKNDVVAVALALMPGRATTEDAGDGVLIEQKTRGSVAWGIAGVTKIGHDLTFGVTAETFEISEVEAIGAGNKYASRYYALRFAMPVAAGVQMGVVIHAYKYDVQRLRFTDNVASDSRGYVYGPGFGMYWGQKPESAASAYFLPTVRGSVDAEGENRVLVRRGRVGADKTWGLASGVLGAGFAYWRGDADGADAEPAAVEYGPLGTPRLNLSVGWRGGFGQKGLYRGSATREFYWGGDEYANVSTLATRLKLGLGTELQGGGEFSGGVAVRLGDANSGLSDTSYLATWAIGL